MTPWSATAWADAPVGAIPGSASAAAKSALAAGAGGRFVSNRRMEARRRPNSGSRTEAAIARNRRLAARSVAATPAPADAVAAGRGFLARVDVLLDFRFELVGVDLHRRFCEVPALPRLRRLHRRAADGGECHEKDERTQRMAHRDLRNDRRGNHGGAIHRGGSNARMRSSRPAFCSSRNPLSTATTLPAVSIK